MTGFVIGSYPMRDARVGHGADQRSLFLAAHFQLKMKPVPSGDGA